MIRQKSHNNHQRYSATVITYENYPIDMKDMEKSALPLATKMLLKLTIFSMK